MAEKRKKESSGFKRLNSDSESVTKKHFKRFGSIFNRSGAGHNLSEVETHNAYYMIKSKKNFNDAEIRHGATNPGGRLGTRESADAKRRKANIAYSDSRKRKK